jgi:SRSO17 transposase
VSVEVVVSDGEIAAPVAGRLYLPESWASDPARRDAAGVPPEVKFQTKPMIALDLIREVLAAGVTPAPVLGDEVYGASSELRRALRTLEMEYFFNVGGDLLAWTRPVKTRFAKKYWDVADGQPPAASLESLSRTLRGKQWRSVAWHAADGTKRKTRIGWLPVYAYSDLDALSGDWPQSWLVVDWPEGAAEPYHLYLASFKQAPSAMRCLRLSRGRFPVEQFFQRDKFDLGLDHYEGRSWQGFHHHLVLAAVAYLFVTVIYLRSKKNFWCYVGTGAPRDAALASAADRMLSLLRE